MWIRLLTFAVGVGLFIESGDQQRFAEEPVMTAVAVFVSLALMMIATTGPRKWRQALLGAVIGAAFLLFVLATGFRLLPAPA